MSKRHSPYFYTGVDCDWTRVCSRAGAGHHFWYHCDTIYSCRSRICLELNRVGGVRACRRHRTFPICVREEQWGRNDHERCENKRQKKSGIHSVRPGRRRARSGNRIVPAGAEGMTPPNTAECKPNPSPRAVAFEGFDRVRRTRGIIATRRWEHVP